MVSVTHCFQEYETPHANSILLQCYGRKLSALVLLHLHRDAISEKVRLSTIASGHKAIIYQEGDMNVELKISQNWRIFSKFRTHGDLMLYHVWWWGNGS